MRLQAHHIRWSGFTAMVAGAGAVLLTFPFAAAYGRAYPGFDAPPFWLPAFLATFDHLLTFATPVAVYTLYGRIFNLVYLLLLPAVITIHMLQRKTTGRFETWAFFVLVAGLIVSFVGVAGDYWADGAGWTVELLGLLVLLVGTTLFGITVQTPYLPRWSTWLLMGAGPSALASTWLIGHIPSGPTFPIAVVWIVLGYLLWNHDDKPTTIH